MAVVTMRQLLESGVHFGHQTRRWNPKMKRFIMTERNGIYIIDLQQSVTYINNAYEFVRETVAHGGTILFVGTKRQAQDGVADAAKRSAQYFVNSRWLGGTLTNWKTVSGSIKRLRQLDDMLGSGESAQYTKKERLTLQRERDKLAEAGRLARLLSRTIKLDLYKSTDYALIRCMVCAGIDEPQDLITRLIHHADKMTDNGLARLTELPK